MEAEKCQATVSKLKIQETWWCGSSPKAGKFKTQEEPIFQLNWKKNDVPVQGWKVRGVPFYSQKSQSFWPIQAFTWLYRAQLR